MEIRYGKYDDADQVVALVTTLLTPACTRVSKVDPSRLWETVVNLMLDKPHALIVADNGDRIVGCIGLHVAPYFWTRDLAATELFWFVDAEYRGNAIASQLLYAALDHCKEVGVTELGMGVLHSSPEHARRKYESLGFRELQTLYTKRIE